MKLKSAIMCLAFWTLAQTALSTVRVSHQFTPAQCGSCHISAKARAIPSEIRPVISPACIRCHNDRDDAFSHPVNIVPNMSLPADMPLEDGRMACLTCHFAHPQKNNKRPHNRALLRKPGPKAHFCARCHGLRTSGHRVFELAHRTSSDSMPQAGTLDRHSLQCLECHDRHLTRISRGTGAGRWQPFDPAKRNHPVGIVYAQATARFPLAYAPATTLPKQLRLYDGHIGCGTCHSAYSKAKFMLTVDNSRSRLCMSCHVK